MTNRNSTRSKTTDKKKKKSGTGKKHQATSNHFENPQRFPQNQGKSEGGPDVRRRSSSEEENRDKEAENEKNWEENQENESRIAEKPRVFNREEESNPIEEELGRKLSNSIQKYENEPLNEGDQEEMGAESPSNDGEIKNEEVERAGLQENESQEIPEESRSEKHEKTSQIEENQAPSQKEVDVPNEIEEVKENHSEKDNSLDKEGGEHGGQHENEHGKSFEAKQNENSKEEKLSFNEKTD